MKRIVYAANDCVAAPIRADRWMWQLGNNWVAVAPFESEEEWFQDLDPSECPTPRVRPIDDIPTTGTLTYMRSNWALCEMQASQAALLAKP